MLLALIIYCFAFLYKKQPGLFKAHPKQIHTMNEDKPPVMVHVSFNETLFIFNVAASRQRRLERRGKVLLQ